LIGGLAGPLFLPGTERLIATVGWRDTTLVLAGAMILAGAINALILPKGIPRADADGRPPVRPVRLLRDRRFVLFTIAMALSFGAFQSVFFHRIAVFEEAGFTVATVTLWAAASSVLSLPGRYAGPYLAERLGGIKIYAIATTLSAAAVVVMVGAETWRMPTHFVGFGLTFGAMLPIRAVVMSHWYSGPGYGRIMGAQWSFAAVAGAAMPALTGVVRDRAGDYAPALIAVAALFGLAAVTAFLSGRRTGATESG